MAVGPVWRRVMGASSLDADLRSALRELGHDLTMNGDDDGAGVHRVAPLRSCSLRCSTFS